MLAFTTSIITTTIHVPNVQADEGDTLYCINNSDVKIRPYAGTGTVTDIARLAISTVNNGGRSKVDLFDAVGAKVDNQWTIIDPSTCKPTKFTRMTGFVDNIPNDNIPANLNKTVVDASTRNPHSGIGIGYNGSMIDSDGRLWFSTDSKKTPTLDQHASETYRFSHIAGYSNDTAYVNSGVRFKGIDLDNGFTKTGNQYGSTLDSTTLEQQIETNLAGTVLLGRRINDQPSTAPTTVMQMPTTGAPDGLSTVGLLAIGIGLAGVTLVLARRRE